MVFFTNYIWIKIYYQMILAYKFEVIVWQILQGGTNVQTFFLAAYKSWSPDDILIQVAFTLFCSTKHFRVYNQVKQANYTRHYFLDQ